MRNDRRVLPVGCPFRPLPPGLAKMMAAVCAAGTCCVTSCRHRGGSTGDVQALNASHRRRCYGSLPTGRPISAVHSPGFHENVVFKNWASVFHL